MGKINMRFTLTVGGTKLVMTAEQLDAMTHILEGCEAVFDHSVGKDLGTHGYNMSYIHHIKPYNINDSLEVKVMSEESYEATKLVTKLNKED
jgi:malate synthase